MSHPNAALTPRHRLKVARLVVDDGWPISEVAARFQVSWPIVKRWVDRHLAGESMQDRSSRPKTSPKKTPKAVSMFPPAEVGPKVPDLGSGYLVIRRKLAP